MCFVTSVLFKIGSYYTSQLSTSKPHHQFTRYTAPGELIKAIQEHHEIQQICWTANPRKFNHISMLQLKNCLWLGCLKMLNMPCRNLCDVVIIYLSSGAGWYSWESLARTVTPKKMRSWVLSPSSPTPYATSFSSLKTSLCCKLRWACLDYHISDNLNLFSKCQMLNKKHYDINEKLLFLKFTHTFTETILLQPTNICTRWS